MMCLNRGEEKKLSGTFFYCMKLPEIQVEVGKARSDQADPIIPQNFECSKLITERSSFAPYPKFVFESSS